MAPIDKRTRTLFFTTSPRTPSKMIPEILLLANEFSQEVWNEDTQVKFMERLTEQDCFIGNKNPKDPALSARDRITRAPKALGFIELKPVIQLTPAGEEYALGDRPEEALLRQLLKFQLPSPYHPFARGSDQDFFVKPYLEILRLVRHLGSLTFDELMLFGMQLTSFSKFDCVIEKIEQFRLSKARSRGKYRKFFAQYCDSEIAEIYHREIVAGRIGVRESSGETLTKFIGTKKRNLRDYADACFRYLRATGIVAVSQIGHSLSIPKDRKDDVDFLLKTVSQEPVFVDNEEAYKKYLFDSSNPPLYSDNSDMIVQKIKKLNPDEATDGLSVSELKDKEMVLRTMKRLDKLEEEITRIKEYVDYDSIQSTFENITQQKYYDNPLMLEWNAWRAMTMLDGGNIEGNYKLDDEGMPLSTAAGNVPDIYCDYESFGVTVEVTLQSGQKQYDNEGEPVARHLGRMVELTGKETFCLFIAPTINPATIAHFFMLHKVNVKLYGGKAIIVPLELAVFRKMVEDSYKMDYIPTPEKVKALFAESKRIAECAEDESEWYQDIRDYALNWLRVG